LITHFLGVDEVKAYCSDLVSRLIRLGPQFPKIWFTLGKSGSKMAAAVLREMPDEFKSQVSLAFVNYNRETAQIEFLNELDGANLSVAPVLVIDSIVNTGKSMLRLIKAIRSRGAIDIISYSLVIKRNSALVPTYFGTVIDDKDKMYLQLHKLPNNRLSEKQPFFVLREITFDDHAMTIGSVGDPFEDIAAGDLLYEFGALNCKVYVAEHDRKILSFISFRKNGHTLYIDSWGSVKQYRGQGVGGPLLRWAETWARSTKCDRIELWAFEGAIPIYQYYGYTFLDDKWRVLTSVQRYKIMEKRVEYNLKIQEIENTFVDTFPTDY
jgi:GNAT superfamily N-acetyltransferase